jgi:hypothetical protein
VTVFAGTGATQGPLAAGSNEQIDRAVGDVLARTGAPSASIAIVQDGRPVPTRSRFDSRCP